MTMRSFVFAFAVAAGTAAPGHAQVIEIDSSGVAQTYDGPTVFSGDSTAPIRVKPRRMADLRVTAGLIADAAQVHGLDPSLLQAVAWQESRGRTRAISAKGALGVMQLMPDTAAELNVDREDLVDNIRGGAIYLRRQLDRFGGSVPLALAAYNAGPGAVVKYGGIPPYRETQNYVATILGRWRTSPASPTPALLIIEAAQ